MEEWFHLVAPGNEGDIIAKPAMNCRETVKVQLFGFAVVRLAGASRSSSDALFPFDVAPSESVIGAGIQSTVSDGTCGTSLFET